MKATCSHCRKEITDDYPITVIWGKDLNLFCDIQCRNIIEGEMVPTGVKGGRGEVSLLQRHITNLEGKFVVI
jgi:hypothetical protein